MLGLNSRYRRTYWRDGQGKPPYGLVEIDWDHPLARGLLVYWLFNEGGGLTTDIANMVAANGIREKGTLNGSPVWRPSKFGSGLLIDSPSKYVQNQTLRNIALATVSARVVFNTISPASFPVRIGGFVNGNGGTIDDKELGLMPANNIRWYIFDGSVKTVDGATTIVAGVPYNVMGLNDGTTSYLYLDGQQDGSVAAGNSYTGYGGGANILMGGNSSNFNATGSVDFDYFAVWSRALTPLEAEWVGREPYAFLRAIQRRRIHIPPPVIPLALRMSMQVESLRSLARKVSIPVESTGALMRFSGVSMPIESRASLARKGSSLQVESLKAWARRVKMPIESRGGVLARCSMPVESLARLALKVRIPIESSGITRLALQMGVSVESLARVFRRPMLQVESDGENPMNMSDVLTILRAANEPLTDSIEILLKPGVGDLGSLEDQIDVMESPNAFEDMLEIVQRSTVLLRSGETLTGRIAGVNATQAEFSYEVGQTT